MLDDPRSLTDTGLTRRLRLRRREVETAEAIPDASGGPVMMSARYRELERLEREAARRHENEADHIRVPFWSGTRSC